MNYTFDVVQGDSRFPLEVQLWETADDEDDLPINLDDAERVLLHIYFRGTLLESIETEVFSDARNGTVMNDYWGDLFSEKGKYRMDAEVEFIDGGSKTMENQVIFKVRAKGGR